MKWPMTSFAVDCETCLVTFVKHLEDQNTAITAKQSQGFSKGKQKILIQAPCSSWFALIFHHNPLFGFSSSCCQKQTSRGVQPAGTACLGKKRRYGASWIFTFNICSCIVTYRFYKAFLLSNMLWYTRRWIKRRNKVMLKRKVKRGNSCEWWVWEGWRSKERLCDTECKHLLLSAWNSLLPVIPLF